jgi:hypothetical protein
MTKRRASEPCEQCTFRCAIAFHANPTALRPAGGCAQRGCGCARTRDSFYLPAGVAASASPATKSEVPLIMVTAPRTKRKS